MTALHLRAMLTATSLEIPVDDGRLSLGTWQGIYLFEHRARASQAGAGKVPGDRLIIFFYFSKVSNAAFTASSSASTVR